MTLTQMFHFCSVVEAHSFRAASEKLFVSRQALSRSVHQLETELHVELMQKDRNNQLIITDSGMLLYEKMKDILSDVDELRRIAGSHAYDKRNLRIVFSDTLAPILSRNILNSLVNASFLKENKIENITQVQNDELSDGNFGHYDMAFIFGNSNRFSQYNTKVFSSQNCCIDVPYTHACFHHDEIAWEELAGQPLLMPFSPETIGLGDILVKYDIKPIILTNLYTTGHTAITNACCVLDVPFDSADNDFHQLPLRDSEEFEIEIFAAWKKDIDPKTVKNIFHLLRKSS